MAGYPRAPLAERFWAKVRKGNDLYEWTGYGVSIADACWEWQGCRHRFGHGYIGLGGRKGGTSVVHRVSWELHYGPIPDGLVVRHRCDNPPCVNPAHLLLGTQADNMADMVSRGRQACGPNNGRARMAKPEVSRVERLATSGERNHKAKLTAAQVQEIRLALIRGDLQREIASRYGVKQMQISRIKLNKAWQSTNAERGGNHRGTQ
jgi:HNH endonuclease